MFPTFGVQNYAFIATLQKYDKGIFWNLKDLFFYNIKNSVLIITHVKTDRIKGTLRFHSELLPNGYHTYGAHRGIISNSSSALLKFLNPAHRKAHSNATIDLQNYCNSLTPTPSLPLKTGNQAATTAAANQYHFISYVACNYCDKG